ncbi:MAG: leucine-rich repeat domain-containing protein [Ruminococcaceae bacterium]|nr:leucine-rich repeat domain-containing protein [Oscillospiraceae bacterium]
MDNLIIKDNIVIGCSEPDILSVKIPEGVIAIGDNAFLDFRRLSEIQLPSTLKKIGDKAFKGCESLKLINIENVSMIGVRAFAGCKSLSKIHFGDNIIGYLCNATFCGCTAIEEIDIPKNISYIGCECFKDCTGLTDIKLAGVMEIDNGAFEHCTELYSIAFPYSLLHIAPNAFSFCTKLQSVIMQNRFIDIDETAFEYNVNLIIKAAQFSTAYHYAIGNGFTFTPTIISADYRIVTNEDVAILSKAGILFRMKVIDSSTVIISFDKSAKSKIENLIGSDKHNRGE